MQDNPTIKREREKPWVASPSLVSYSLWSGSTIPAAIASEYVVTLTTTRIMQAIITTIFAYLLVVLRRTMLTPPDTSTSIAATATSPAILEPVLARLLR